MWLANLLSARCHSSCQTHRDTFGRIPACRNSSHPGEGRKLWLLPLCLEDRDNAIAFNPAITGAPCSFQRGHAAAPQNESTPQLPAESDLYPRGGRALISHDVSFKEFKIIKVGLPADLHKQICIWLPFERKHLAYREHLFSFAKTRARERLPPSGFKCSYYVPFWRWDMEGKKQSEGMGVARVSLRGGPKLVRGTGYSRDAVRTPHLRFRSVRSAQSGTVGAPAALVPTRSRSESTRLLAVFQHFCASEDRGQRRGPGTLR